MHLPHLLENITAAKAALSSKIADSSSGQVTLSPYSCPQCHWKAAERTCLFHLKKKRPRVPKDVYNYLMCMEEREPRSTQGRQWQATDASWKMKNSPLSKKKITMKVVKHWGRSPESMWDFNSWRYSELSCPGPWRICSRWIYLGQDLHRSLFTSAVLWLYEQNPNRIQERDFASVCSSTPGGSSLAATHKICTQQQAATARAITTALGKWSCLSSQERSVWGCSAGSVCAKHWFDDLNGAADLLFLLGSCNTLTRLALWKTQARSAALMTVMYPW